ncbi:hypothetical protein GCM10017786_20010 [Amycolatopsis deserti]|uniref:Uncharacterized protein n=1 Tax=Amycolatopsis deserti TaxID=185696 RepID=A0ABQ3IQ86_9PSEU|nr:hypothetical protein [Amycolatopsis deserti]GHE88076.1 hypothetical protein GCM10017786_20010 [Amycolatopsis deserti]
MTLLFAAVQWAVGSGQYTLTAKWHRLSDTLAADAIALGLAALASWWLARRSAVHPYEGNRRVGRVVIGSIAALAALACLTHGGILWGVPLAREGPAGVDECAGTIASAWRPSACRAGRRR